MKGYVKNEAFLPPNGKQLRSNGGKVKKPQPNKEKCVAMTRERSKEKKYIYLAWNGIKSRLFLFHDR